MPTFAYLAKDNQGQRVTGTHEAADGAAAVESLRDQGLTVTRMAPVGKREVVAAAVQGGHGGPPPRESLPEIVPPTPPPPLEVPAPRREFNLENAPPIVPQAPAEVNQPRFSAGHVATQPFLTADAKQMSLFFRQMHAMIHAGSSVGQALKLMAENAPNGALRHACGQMSTRCTSGEEWNVTMRAYPGLFSELMVGMVTAGEMGGFLDRMCQRLADYSERDYEIQQTIKRETLYPKILFACAIFIPSMVPLVLGTITGGVAAGLGAWFAQVKLPIIVGILCFIGWKFMQKTMPGTLGTGPSRLAIDELKLKAPAIGKCVRALAAAKFCRALAALMAGGMGMHKTIVIASNACGNEAIGRRAKGIIHRLDNGETLTEALRSTGVFPPIVIQMLATGESSGSVDTQLDKAADFLEQDAETSIKAAVKFVGVGVFLLVAIMIGAQLIGFYRGYAEGITDMVNGS